MISPSQVTASPAERVLQIRLRDAIRQPTHSFTSLDVGTIRKADASGHLVFRRLLRRDPHTVTWQVSALGDRAMDDLDLVSQARVRHSKRKSR